MTRPADRPRPARVIVIVPDGQPRSSGNWTTADRLVDGLRRRGLVAACQEAGSLTEPSGPPVVFHALHALHSAPAALARLRPGHDRLVTALTGTDTDGGDQGPLRSILERSDAVVAFHPLQAPDQAPTARVVPPGVEPLPGRRRRAAFGWPAGETVLVLPSGLRPVKDPTFALAPLAGLRAAGWPLRLVVAGPLRDGPLGEELGARLAVAGPWVQWLGEVSRAAMGDLYRSADVVLNTSLREGLSNALLEAMACRRPVLASDIPGNRAAVTDGRTGLLYRPGDASDFSTKALELLRDPDRRRRLAAAAARHVRRQFSPEREIDAYLDLYASLFGN